MNFFGNLLLSLFISSSYASASWNCTATCKGTEKKILSSISCGFTPGQYSDFVANCRQVLGGTVAGSSCTYCGAYQVCEKYESSSYTVSGTGSDLMSARQDARKSCQGQNQTGSSGGYGCPYEYRAHQLEESSLNCSQSLHSGLPENTLKNFTGKANQNTRLTCNLVNPKGQKEAIIYDSKINQALYLNQFASVQLKNCKNYIVPNGNSSLRCEATNNGQLAWESYFQKTKSLGRDVVFAWLNRIDRFPQGNKATPLFTKIMCQ